MKPTLFGYGLTTRAIAKKEGGGCIFFDDNTQTPYTDEEGNSIYPSSAFSPKEHPLTVTTPSLPPSHPLIQQAPQTLSEYDYILKEQNHTPFTIWISGTNGKTTTTQMITHLLQHKGAISGGNIGIPLAQLDPHAPIWVLETSSFTLHHTHHASPNLYILLPITPDHLDWHGSKEAYEADKLKPLLSMKEGELALVPKGLKLPQTSAYVVEYDSPQSLCDYFNLEDKALHYSGAFLEDALLALCVTATLFDERDYALLNRFKRDAHRQEPLLDSQQRLWVNDSKATNLDATLQALKSYNTQPLHLIVGGEDKGVELTPLFEALQHQPVTLYAIGANKKKLMALAKQYHIKAYLCETLAKAVETIHPQHTSKSVALLSPAGASFDQFSSYKERGECFKRLVQAL
jgi:UDP-N-acetylmuramoylalanine--D-glutamate ligase